jgi:holo-[acyl-carrier protein] synthase
MARGIGIDAVEIERIREVRARRGAAFDHRILSPAEQRLLLDSPTPDVFLAGRFAAKEAVMKVLGTGWAKGVRFADIEVLRDTDGIPVVHLVDGAEVRARALGIRQVLVSITHTKGVALATAIGED